MPEQDDNKCGSCKFYAIGTEGVPFCECEQGPNYLAQTSESDGCGAYQFGGKQDKPQASE